MRFKWGGAQHALTRGRTVIAGCLLTMVASTPVHAIGGLPQNLNEPVPSFMLYFNELKVSDDAAKAFGDGLQLSLMMLPSRAKEALYLLDKANSLGHPYAPLAILFTNAISLRQNYEFSAYKEMLLNYLQGEEPLGSTIAAFTIIEATNYLRHYDPTLLLSCLNRSISKSYVPAWYVKGLLLIKIGRFDDGIEQIKKAASLGYAIAQYHLAFLALSNELNMDMTEAFSLLQQALKAGHLGAFRELGYCFEHGIGTHYNLYEAIRLYEQGFHHGDIAAAASYGLLSLQLPNPDYNMCFMALSYAYNNGAPDVANALGTLYLKGLGVKQDQVKGFELIKQAADKGLLVAIKNVIICYENGSGTPKDLGRAADYREKLQLMLEQQKDLNKDPNSPRPSVPPAGQDTPASWG